MVVTGRYDSFIYGDGTLYGETGTTGLLLWVVEIDWNQDNVFDGSNEASRMFSIQWSRGRKKMLKQPSIQGSKAVSLGFETIPPGSCTIKLRNGDGRFDASNQDSPLYPFVTSGPDVRIRNVNQNTSVWNDIFFGTIVDIKPYGYGADAYVEIKIEDGSRILRANTARSPIAEEITPGQAINNILNAANWPPHWGRNIDNGYDTINYHWVSGNKISWTELEDVSESFLGLFFISANGKARFIDRNSVPVSVMDLNQDILLKDIDNPSPWFSRRNIVRLKVHPMAKAIDEVIYQVTGDPLLVEAGSSRTIWPSFTYNNASVPVQDIISPVATTDYLAYTNSDGTGANRTADCSVTVYNFGDNAKMVFTNTTGTNFYVTFRQIRGTAIYEENVADITYPEDFSTVTNQREFVLDLRWQQSANIAADYAIVLGEFLDRQNNFPVVKMQGRPEYQFTPDLFDVIGSLDIEKLGIVGTSFRVGSIEGKSLSDTCQDIETKFYLEPYLTNGDAWTWPITNFGVDTVFGAG